MFCELNFSYPMNFESKNKIVNHIFFFQKIKNFVEINSIFYSSNQNKMGQHLSVDTSPISIHELKKTNSTENQIKYHKNIKIWECRDSDVQSLNFEKFSSFSNKSSYIVLVLKRKDEQLDEIENSSKQKSEESLFEVCQTATRNLSPRGLSTEFFEPSFEFSESNKVQLFLWNGKKTSKITQAFALANCYELENILNQQDVEKLMDVGSPQPISNFYKCDVEDASNLFAPELYNALIKKCSLINSLIQKTSSPGSVFFLISRFVQII
jgi:hypothetical protein